MPKRGPHREGPRDFVRHNVGNGLLFTGSGEYVRIDGVRRVSPISGKVEGPYCMYEGGFQNIFFHGEGVLTQISAGVPTIFKGMFRYNQLTCPDGVVTCNNPVKHFGFVYKGPLLNKLKHGDNGKIVYDDGSTHDGGWKDDKYHGPGISTFVGSTGHRLPTGLGELGDDMTTSPPVKYNGGWNNGKVHGGGLLEFRDGDRYFGYWADGVPYNGNIPGQKLKGICLYQRADGTSFRVIWGKGGKHPVLDLD